VVWASPRKHAQIEEFIELYEKGDIPSAVEGLPRKEIKLSYADAYDAMYELQDFIDALWSGDKPKVDYIPFTSMLVIKSRNLDTDLYRASARSSRSTSTCPAKPSRSPSSAKRSPEPRSMTW
jgi:hypothetical protein